MIFHHSPVQWRGASSAETVFHLIHYSAIIPMGLGGLVTVLVFSRLMALVFDRAYALLFHIITGLVLASTILIIPGRMGLLCVASLGLGVLLDLWMCKLEAEHKL